MRSVFRVVEEARRESAILGRDYFDAEWKKNLPGRDVPEVNLVSYDWDWFEAAMQPHREAFKAADTPRDVLADISKVGMKEAENGGRRTIIRAVEQNDELVAWARVDYQPPTCGFCLMLISRGPVYKSETTATRKKDERTLYHTGCTCKAVPVFANKDWEGREQWQAMESLWKDTTAGYSGKDALNAFRRALEEKPPKSMPVAA